MPGAPIAGSVGGLPEMADMRTYWQVWNLLDRDFLGQRPDATERTNGAIAGMPKPKSCPTAYTPHI